MLVKTKGKGSDGFISLYVDNYVLCFFLASLVKGSFGSRNLPKRPKSLSCNFAFFMSYLEGTFLKEE